MKYCADYFSSSNKLDKVDEINLQFNKENSEIDSFIDKYSPKRVNMCISNYDKESIDNMLKLFNAFVEKYKDTKFVLRIPFNIELMNKCKENDIPFYFANFASTWDIFIGYIMCGVTDVYIVEDMGFDLDQVATIAHAANIQVRAFPNIAQSSYQLTPDLKKFFIRPEDIKVYEKYIDVIEFYADIDKFDTLYEIYAEHGEWYGPLNEIILNFNIPLDSRSILSVFADRRVKCGKRCIKGRPCNICEAVVNLSKTLSEKNIAIEKIEPKEEVSIEK